MNQTELGHRLVARYLKEFDAAASVLPVPRARELREQVVTHIGEAVGPEAGDEEVAAVLAGLGSPRVLVAEAAATVGKRSWAARFGWQGWLAVAAITTAIAVPSGTVLFWQAQPGLQFRYSFAWWSPVDGARPVTTEAAGATQDTVPIRPGKIQGFAILVYNPSDLTHSSGAAPSPSARVRGSRPRSPCRRPRPSGRWGSRTLSATAQPARSRRTPTGGCACCGGPLTAT